MLSTTLPPPPPTTLPRRPHAVDIEAGRRLKAARRLAGMSQSKLGDAVGLTFQQVQKYEKGLNRISASRLSQFAQLLNVPPSYFFAELAPDATEPLQAAPGSLSRDEAALVRHYRAAPEAIRRASRAMLEAGL